MKRNDDLLYVSTSLWLQNIRKIQNPQMNLEKTYSPDLYPRFDNYDAINVNRTKDIPKDYEGMMGIPLTSVNILNTDEFEILYKVKDGFVNGENVFTRLMVKRKR